MQYTDLMVDCETLGVKNNAIVLQIGLCLFNRKDQTVPIITKDWFLNLEDMLDYMQSGGFTIDASTIAFWAKQPGFSKLLLRCTEADEKYSPVEITHVVDDFIRDIVGEYQVPRIELNGTGIYVWDIDVWALGNKDFAWLDNLFIRPIWPFWRECDLRTYARAAPNAQRVYSTNAHDAKADARAQVEWLYRIEEELHGKN